MRRLLRPARLAAAVACLACLPAGGAAQAAPGGMLPQPVAPDQYGYLAYQLRDDRHTATGRAEVNREWWGVGAGGALVVERADGRVGWAGSISVGAVLREGHNCFGLECLRVEVTGAPTLRGMPGDTRVDLPLHVAVVLRSSALFSTNLLWLSGGAALLDAGGSHDTDLELGMGLRSTAGCDCWYAGFGGHIHGGVSRRGKGMIELGIHRVLRRAR